MTALMPPCPTTAFSTPTIARLTPLAALLLWAGPPARAHVAPSAQIADLTARIARDADDAALYLKRGELHRAQGDWSAAKADYLRARRLDPDLEAVDLCLGRMDLDEGRPQAAREALDRFLSRRPDHAAALLLRGRALRGLGLPLEASRDFTRAIQKAGEGELRPEHFLEKAAALAAAGENQIEAALRSLDDGIAALGPVVTLQLAAIDLELRAGRYDDALARTEAAMARSDWRGSWLVRRGEILERAGRACLARREHEAALQAIAGLPAARRATRMIRSLEEQARAALTRMAAGGCEASR